MFFVFVDDISFTHVKFIFKIITVAVELKCYSNVKVINSIKSFVLWKGGGVWCHTGDIPVWQC